MKVIETDRLILRTWQDTDEAEYHRINQDPKVLELLRDPMSMQEVHDFIQFANRQFDEKGFTLWACEEKASGKLLGFIGLNLLGTEMPFGPAVEIGWRLGSEYWGAGFATEGAKAVIEYGLNTCGLPEIVSFTVPKNIRSLRVMEKIGMTRDKQGDFAHPKLAADHKLSKHVLYRIQKKLRDEES